MKKYQAEYAHNLKKLADKTRKELETNGKVQKLYDVTAAPTQYSIDINKKEWAAIRAGALPDTRFRRMFRSIKIWLKKLFTLKGE